MVSTARPEVLGMTMEIAACTTVIPSANTTGGRSMSGVTIPLMTVSTMLPLSSTTKMARANPISVAANAIERKPSTNARAVPSMPRPASRPASTPIAKNKAPSWSKPQS